MSNLIHVVEADTCTEAWLTATNHLLQQPNHERYNLVLGIRSPIKMTPRDFKIFYAVNQFLVDHEQPAISTVAGTIFPANHYQADGADGVYDGFPSDYSELKTSWGTYAMRMLRKQGKDRTINPLKEMIEKMVKHKDKFHSAYEMNVATEDEPFEIPIYQAELDYKRLMPQPCLSHLSFKRDKDNNSLLLTVMYRSHYYATKALGNLIGLAQLQSFVASEVGLEVGPLVCHSTRARVDTDTGMGIIDIRQLLMDCVSM